MISIANRENCCGCSACESVCPIGAIDMKPDNMGFLYPVVNKDKCVDCGLCDKVCSFNDAYDKTLNLSSPQSYSFRHKDISEVATSRSGAAFVCLADWILENGGVVYGVGYDDNFKAIHKRAASEHEIKEFKGSKYVQSDLNKTFKLVKNDLISGRLVLFSGTPCQTSGLASYIGPKLRENLFLIDIVCHGVPAPNIWRDYLRYITKKQKENILELSFRDKSDFGWAAHKESFTFSSKKIYKNTYTYLFYKHIMFRPSCKVCPFTNLTRPSDVTLADFWGWEKVDKTLNEDDKGISLVLCNTDKGVDLFNKVKDRATYSYVETSQCLQPNLQAPSTFHPRYIEFEEDYFNRGLKFIIWKYGNHNARYYLKLFFKKVRTFIRLVTGK